MPYIKKDPTEYQKVGPKEKSFTTQEIETVKRLNAQHVPLTKISQQTGKSVFLIKKILQIKTENATNSGAVLTLKKAGKTNTEISAELGISREEVKKITKQLWQSINN